eukprot:3847111-Rhodomonas_salina.1
MSAALPVLLSSCRTRRCVAILSRMPDSARVRCAPSGSLPPNHSTRVASFALPDAITRAATDGGAQAGRVHGAYTRTS